MDQLSHQALRLRERVMFRLQVWETTDSKYLTSKSHMRLHPLTQKDLNNILRVDANQAVEVGNELWSHLTLPGQKLLQRRQRDELN